jgi:hypothetical protein
MLNAIFTGEHQTGACIAMAEKFADILKADFAGRK